MLLPAVASATGREPPATRRRSYTEAPMALYLALDAKTGKPVTTFGNDGVVDLKAGVGTEKYPNPRVGVSSPVAIYKNYVIPGCSPGEGPAFNTACDIRAFDLRTGKLVWTFHTLPRPGEANHDVWKDGQWENRAGLNNWGFISVDVRARHDLRPGRHTQH